MSRDVRYETALGALRGALAGFKPGDRLYDELVSPREEVLARFQPVFSPDHIPSLTRDEFVPFLYFDNNRHWTGLHRQGLRATQDMDALRRCLSLLLDESIPIEERLPQALEMVPGVGKALATAILTVAYPEKYGVWNNTSEAGLRRFELWPRFERGEGIGSRYEKINRLLLQLSADLGLDLWALDSAWWYLAESEDQPDGELQVVAEPTTRGSSFSLERQLEEFLLENWDRTILGEEWEIYRTPDDPEAGRQYPTDVGRIDILAVHRKEPRFLVVELKRRQGTDETVGQALRYLGWVQRHLADRGQRVEALIIAHRFDKQAEYAVSMLNNVRLMTYEVQFQLRELAPGHTDGTD